MTKRDGVATLISARVCGQMTARGTYELVVGGMELRLDELTGIGRVTVHDGEPLSDRVHEFVGILRACYQHERYRQKLLWDLREVSLAKIRTERLLERAYAAQREISAARPEDAPPGHCAFVVSTAVDYGLMRVAVGHMQQLPITFGVFPDVPAAQLWLVGPKAPSHTGELFGE